MKHQQPIWRLGKRTISIFSIFLAVAIGLFYRVYDLSEGETLSMASGRQSRRILEVASNRGMIYDRDLKPMVNLGQEIRAAVLPSSSSLKAVMDAVEDEKRDGVLEIMQQGRPFVLDLPTPNVYARGVNVFEVWKRYLDPPLAPHIIGYTDTAGGNGKAGIEKAFDSQLSKPEAAISVAYQVDALGTAIEGAELSISRDQYEVKDGVVLTLDRDIQEICEAAARESFSKGAVVVMEPSTGNLIADVSLPEFSQNDVAASLEVADSPLFNRSLGAYSVGSTFKIVMACAALDNGFSLSRTYTCKGYEDIGGQVFLCNNQAGHGKIDMHEAIQESCNTYFIDLMKDLGPEVAAQLARNIGFGIQDGLADGITGAAGNLPTSADLRNPAEASNFSFGQGKLTATPIQIAKLFSTVVNGGNSVTPRLVEGFSNEDGTAVASHQPLYASNSIVSARTASAVKSCLIDVVEEGSGKRAKPKYGGAGGKTGSAQTGLFDKEGEEKVHAWFAGFYPAISPRYVIVVFVEDGVSGALAAAPVFQKIADGIADLEGITEIYPAEAAKEKLPEE